MEIELVDDEVCDVEYIKTLAVDLINHSSSFAKKLNDYSTVYDKTKRKAVQNYARVDKVVLEYVFINLTSSDIIIKNASNSQFVIPANLNKDSVVHPRIEIYSKVPKSDGYTVFTVYEDELRRNIVEGVYISELDILIGLGIEITNHPKYMELSNIFSLVGSKLLDSENQDGIIFFMNSKTGPDEFYVSAFGYTSVVKNLKYTDGDNTKTTIIVCNKKQKSTMNTVKTLTGPNPEMEVVYVKGTPIIVGTNKLLVEIKSKDMAKMDFDKDVVKFSTEINELNNKILTLSEEKEKALTKFIAELNELKSVIASCKSSEKDLVEKLEAAVSENKTLKVLLENLNKIIENEAKQKANRDKAKIHNSVEQRETIKLTMEFIKYGVFILTTITSVIIATKMKT